MTSIRSHFLENRIPPPLLTLAVGAAMWGISRMQPAITLNPSLKGAITSAVSLFGIVIGPAGILEFRRRKTTMNPVKIDQASQLVTTGIYRFTRNPMYVGLTALLTAWALWLAVPSTLLGPILFALFINRFQIIPEERVMKAQFGSAYDLYLRQVRRWL